MKGMGLGTLWMGRVRGIWHMGTSCSLALH